MAGSTTRESDKFMLRFPDGMRDRIKAEADKNGRSMNAEIIQAIEAHLSRPRFAFDPGPNVEPSGDDLFDPLDHEGFIARTVRNLERQLREHLREQAEKD